jgi:ATP-binding cassette subfamily C protein CydC
VALLVAGLMAVFLGSFDPRLAAGLLAFFLAAGVGLPLLTYLLSRRPGGTLVTGRARLNATLVDGIQGMADLVAFGQESAQLARLAALSDEMIGLQQQMARIGGLHAGLGSLLTSLAVLAVLILAIPQVNAGQIAGVNLAVLVLAAAASFEAVLPLPLAAQYLGSSLAAGRRLLEIAGGPRADTDSAVTGLRISQFDIRFEGVCFRYAPADPPALDRVSFAVPAGGRVAIVGPSGAGKSTLVNLLLRFWDYQEGHIWLAGRELREWEPGEVRQLIAVVTQSTYLFNATVRDNLLLARPEATQAELEQAARRAQIHDFILSLPQGYDTWIGEQGLRLSGGERQRLAIARALLKDAPILILDEATANLDPITERAVFQAMRTLMAGRTTLIITHRPAGLEAVDGIVTLRAGRVVGSSPSR